MASHGGRDDVAVERLQAVAAAEPSVDGTVEHAARALLDASSVLASLGREPRLQLAEGRQPVEVAQALKGRLAGLCARQILDQGFVLGAQLLDRGVRGELAELVQERLRAPQAVTQERHQVVGAVQVVGQVVLEGAEAGAGGVGLGHVPAKARGSRVQEVHGVDLQASLVGGGLERAAHGQVLEGLDDAQRVLLLEARLQAPVRRQVALGRVEVDDQEDAAEQLEQLVEFGEDLLEEQVVGLDHEDRAGRSVAEVARHAVVAELHAAVQAGRVDHDRAGLGQLAGGQLEVDAPDRLREVDGRVEAGLVAGRAQALGQLAVGAMDGKVQGLQVAVRLGLARVARDGVLARLGVRDVDHAGVGRQAGDLADVGRRERVHQRGLTTLERPEDQHVSLLLGNLVGQADELVGQVDEHRLELLTGELVRGRLEGGGGVRGRLDQGSNDDIELFAELAEQGAHEAGPTRGAGGGAAR